MDHFEQHIEKKFHALRNVQLSRLEREEIKRALRLHMTEHPIQTPSTGWLVSIRQISLQPILASLAFLVVLGTGTSYAAQTALPGDILYPVKVSVNETIAGAFRTTAASKAEWNATLATRRLEEAETLAVEGRLTPVAQMQLETRFIQHAASFESEISVLQERQDEATLVVADAQSNLEAALFAHETVLSGLDDSDGEKLQPILAKVREKVERVSKMRGETDAKIIAKDGDSVKKAAVEKKEKASKKVTQLPKDIPSETARRAATEEAPATMMAMAADVALDAASNTEAAAKSGEDGQFGRSNNREFDEGSTRLEEGRWGEAFTKFQTVIRDAEKTRILQEAQERLKKKKSWRQSDISDKNNRDGRDN